jgi:hypothetical protein
MSRLSRILEEARDTWSHAGGALSTRVLADLRVYRKRQQTIFIVCELLLVGVVAFCIYWLTHHPESQKWIQWLLKSGIGLGTGGAVEVARRIWKEWSQLDLLIILLREATEAQVNAIIEKLIGKI